MKGKSIFCKIVVYNTDFFYYFEYNLLYFVTYAALLQIWYCRKLRTFRGQNVFSSHLVCVKILHLETLVTPWYGQNME